MAGKGYMSSWWFPPIWKILVKLDHFPKQGRTYFFFETTTKMSVKALFEKIIENDWCRSRGNKSSIAQLDGFFVFLITAKEFCSRCWYFHCGFGHQARLKLPQSGTIFGKNMLLFMCAYQCIQSNKNCNWFCFKILDNVKFCDVRGLRAHARLRREPQKNGSLVVETSVTCNSPWLCFRTLGWHENPMFLCTWFVIHSYIPRKTNK